MRDGWKAWIGLGVSGLLLWWAFSGEELAAVARHLAAGNPLMLITVAAMSAVGGVIRALRWHLLLEPLGVSTKFFPRWAAVNIGFMVNNLLPARFGEIARPFALSKMTSVSMSGALGTVVLERVLDAFALLMLLLVTLCSPRFPANAQVMGQSIGFAVSGGVLVAAAAVVIVTGLVLWPHRIAALVKSLSAPLPAHVKGKVVGRLESFLLGLGLGRRPAALLRVILLSLLLWMWLAGSIWVSFGAFGIKLSFTAAVFTQCAVSMFVALPAGPAFVGTLQAAVLVSVHDVFAVPPEQTLSMAIGYHLAIFLPGTLIGLYSAWTLGLRLRSVASDAKTALEEGS